MGRQPRRDALPLDAGADADAQGAGVDADLLEAADVQQQGVLEAAERPLVVTSTASVATALFKRGLCNQFVQGVVPVAPKDETMVGQAFTLRYIPAREDRNPITAFRNPDHPQRVAIETCPPGWVLVMDARKDARAATAGSILITRLALRGAAGVVTDGGLRDAEGIGRLDMPAYFARPRRRPT